jgi:putative intracellular protease/amidase
MGQRRWQHYKQDMQYYWLAANDGPTAAICASTCVLAQGSSTNELTAAAKYCAKANLNIRKATRQTRHRGP